VTAQEGRGAMRIHSILISVALLLLSAGPGAASEAEKPWGLVERQPGAFEGFTLFAPLKQSTVYLIDMQGRVVHRWDNGLDPGNSVYLLPDGRLLRPTQVTDNAVYWVFT
jgi:hypothetical protein